MLRLFWVGLVLLSLLGLAAAKAATDSLPFNVRPNGQTTTVKHSLEGHTCEFTYAATGGTNEDWFLTLSTTATGKITCVIERPDRASYLYFMRFSASVHQHVDMAHTTILDSNGAALLHLSEWEVKGQTVTSMDGFRGSLRRLEIWA